MIILFYILIGLVTGVLSGMLGIGGGVISVPALFYIFETLNPNDPFLMHKCIATALGSTLITSIGASIAHHKKRALLPNVLKMIVPGLVIGCILGALISTVIPSGLLQSFFGWMALLLSIHFLFPNLFKGEISPHPTNAISFFGALIGALSSLLGVGGGVFMVPLLLAYSVPLKNAVATSSAGTLTTAFVGSVIYLFIAYGKPTGPDTIGFINIPAVLGIGVSSLLTSSFGVKLAHVLPTHIVKRGFALALAVTGISMVLS